MADRAGVFQRPVERRGRDRRRASGGTDESEQAARQALRHPLDEDAWWWATTSLVNTLAHQDRLRECAAVVVGTYGRVTTDANRILVRTFDFAGEGMGFTPPTNADPRELISDADAMGSQWVRCITRRHVAVALVRRGRPAEAAALVQEALAIAAPGVNRLAVCSLSSVLGLITGADQSNIDDVGERAARALELKVEYPLGLGFALTGLLVALERLGRYDDAALVAGYFSANLGLLGAPRLSVEVMTGGPLERFDVPATHGAFAWGRTLGPDQLDDELRRLATGDADR